MTVSGTSPAPSSSIRRLSQFVVLVATLIGVRSLPGEPENTGWTGRTMGTTYSIKVAGCALSEEELGSLRQAVDDRLREVNRQMSHYDPNSELSRFSHSRSTSPFRVSREFARVTRYALELNRQSDGAFDPTLAPLINLWGFGQAGAILEAPPEASIRKALAVVGCRHLTVTTNDELRKDLPQLELNLSAVAKGFGVDEVARLIRSRGITNVFVEIGGEVVAFGRNAAGQRWRVGIELPDPGAGPGEELGAVVCLTDGAIATSGNYRNFFLDDQGKVLSHILDPHTGRPVVHNLACVSVVAEDCLAADGLATALFVLGPDRGLKFIETQPKAAALFIVREPDGQWSRRSSRRFATLTSPEDDGNVPKPQRSNATGRE